MTDRFLQNPGGPFKMVPERPPMGMKIQIMFGEQEWATTHNMATAMMIVAALNRDQSMEWQPLATAPRDGTFVELRGDSGTIRYPYRVVIASYEPEREPDWDGIRCGTIDNFCWRTVQGDHVTDDGPMPTHWRPTS